jgi:hypothetical protein
MRRVFPMLALLVSSACAPEATAPQGSGTIGRVVPIAVPDVWRPAAVDSQPDSLARGSGINCSNPAPAKADSQFARDSAQRWIRIRGAWLRSLADSVRVVSDTTRAPRIRDSVLGSTRHEPIENGEEG